CFLRWGAPEVRDPNPRRRREQGPQQTEVLRVGSDDLVLGRQAETAENDVARFLCLAHECAVIRSALEDAGTRLTGALPQGEYLLEVRLAAAPPLEIAPVEVRHRLDSRSRQRPVRAGVQVRIALEDRELGASLREGHATLAS